MRRWTTWRRAENRTENRAAGSGKGVVAIRMRPGRVERHANLKASYGVRRPHLLPTLQAIG